MNSERTDKIITMLETFRKFPVMYAGRIDVDLTAAWLHGFEAGLSMSTDDGLNAFRQKVLYKRKWKITNVSPSVEMRERGMTPEAIVDELVIIEIEVWKRIAKEQRLAAKRSGLVTSVSKVVPSDIARDTSQ